MICNIDDYNIDRENTHADWLQIFCYNSKETQN